MKNTVSIGLIWMLLFLVVTAGAQENGFIPGRIDLASENTNSPDDSTHNCRFWGMLASGSFNDSSTISHLNSLKELASSNPNGWGFGFYTETLRGGHIPVVYRGMWRADQDCLFDSSARMMLDNLSGSGIAHIRNSSSGYVNIPNPHPFYTKSMQRDFSMLFAHNGTLDKPALVSMLGAYTETNHFSYSGIGVNDPNHDSDLYRLFLMKWIDEHPSLSVTACLKDALLALTTQMGSGFSYNFIMASTCDTLWALCYNNTLSYRTESSPSGYVWEVASQPLGGMDWTKATNQYLYVFSTAKETPDSIPIRDQGFGLDEYIDKNDALRFIFPNPSTGNTINIRIEAKESQQVSLQLYDFRGRILSNLSDIRIQPGENRFIFDIGLLKSGIYCLKLDAGKNSQTKKLVIVD